MFGGLYWNMKPSSELFKLYAICDGFKILLYYFSAERLVSCSNAASPPAVSFLGRWVTSFPRFRERVRVTRVLSLALSAKHVTCFQAFANGDRCQNSLNAKAL